MAIVDFSRSRDGKGRAARSDEIRQTLKRAIMLGELSPGEPLLELEIAGRFACSQGSVREALLALQEEGLVNRLPHRGTRVSDCTEAEAQEMFRLRHGIETRGIARAFSRIDAGLLDALKALIQSMEQAAIDGDEDALADLDRQFHRRLFAAAELPALDPILHRCLVHNQRFKITQSGAVRDLRLTARRHWTIIEAIESGDPEAAIAAIGRHVATIVDLGPDLFPPTDISNRASQTMASPPAAPSPDMQTLLDRLAQEDAGVPDPTTVSPAEGRAIAEEKNRRWQVDQPPMAEVRTITIPADTDLGTADRQAIVFTPEQAKPGAIIFVHGGGFALCSTETHERCTRVLAVEAGRTVISVDYRLAPEDPFPAGLHDVVAAWRAVANDRQAFGIAEGPLLISGDSAGANLALAAMLHEHDAGRRLPVGAVLFYGAFGVDFETESYRDYAEGFGLTTGQMRRYWDWYAPDPQDRSNPLAAPMLATDAQLAAMPPLFLLVAEVDPLASDTNQLKARLDQIGRDDEMYVESGVVHGFLQMTPQLAAARNAMAASGAAVDRLVERHNRNGRTS